MSVMNYHDSRLTALGLLTEVHAGIMARLHPALARAGLSEIDFETVIRLARSPEQRLRMSDLAAQTGLSTSGVTRVVDRLEREGLVARQACPSDRRASYAVLTSVGRERLESVLPEHLHDIDRSFTRLLPDGELETFLASLRKIRDVVRPCATAGAGLTSDAAGCEKAAGRDDHDPQRDDAAVPVAPLSPAKPGL